MVCVGCVCCAYTARALAACKLLLQLQVAGCVLGRAAAAAFSWLVCAMRLLCQVGMASAATGSRRGLRMLSPRHKVPCFWWSAACSPVIDSRRAGAWWLGMAQLLLAAAALASCLGGGLAACECCRQGPRNVERVRTSVSYSY